MVSNELGCEIPFFGGFTDEEKERLKGYEEGILNVLDGKLGKILPVWCIDPYGGERCAHFIAEGICMHFPESDIMSLTEEELLQSLRQRMESIDYDS